MSDYCPDCDDYTCHGCGYCDCDGCCCEDDMEDATMADEAKAYGTTVVPHPLAELARVREERDRLYDLLRRSWRCSYPMPNEIAALRREVEAALSECGPKGEMKS